MKKIYLLSISFLLSIGAVMATNLSSTGPDGNSTSIGRNNKQVVNYYPNPFRDELTIEFDINSVKSIGIYNLLGNKLVEVPTSYDGKTSVNTSMLGAGIYFLQVETDAGLYTYRLVK